MIGWFKRLLRKPEACPGCGPDADIGPCPRLSARCPVERPLEAPEVVTVFAEGQRRDPQVRQTLGYRMNLLWNAQLRLREAGWDDLADDVDAFHSELHFLHYGCGYPVNTICPFKPERPEERME